MRFVLLTASLLLVLSACNTLPYAVPRPIDEPPIVPPVIDKSIIERPSNEPPIGVPQHSDVLPEVTTSLRICRGDDECTKVKADCCGCSAGGQAAVINKEHVAHWTNTLEQKCKEIMCPQVISNDWSCQVGPKCVENKCTLVKP